MRFPKEGLGRTSAKAILGGHGTCGLEAGDYRFPYTTWASRSMVFLRFQTVDDSKQLGP